MFEGRMVAGILVAAGSSTRMGFDKLFYKLDGVEVIRLAWQKLDAHPYIDSLVIVAGDNIRQVEHLLKEYPTQKPSQVVPGGDCRLASVAAGLGAVGEASLVAIHDAARPFVGQELISRTIRMAAEVGAAAPAIPVKDTIKQTHRGLVSGTPARVGLRAVQTPQVFDLETYQQALATIDQADYSLMTDDCMVMESAGKPVALVEGDPRNLKITTIQDLPKTTTTKNSLRIRVGHGYDVHRFDKERRLVLGGVELPHHQGLLGHSDADVLLHAVSDALLGGGAMGDIGQHFPNTDEQYAGASSLDLLQQVAGKLLGKGYRVGNLDATLVCQQPKLAPYLPDMRQNIASALGVEVGQVSVKATTEEGLGFTGEQQGIAAHCVAILVAE